MSEYFGFDLLDRKLCWTAQHMSLEKSGWPLVEYFLTVVGWRPQGLPVQFWPRPKGRARKRTSGPRKPKPLEVGHPPIKDIRDDTSDETDRSGTESSDSNHSVIEDEAWDKEMDDLLEKLRPSSVCALRRGRRRRGHHSVRSNQS